MNEIKKNYYKSLDPIIKFISTFFLAIFFFIIITPLGIIIKLIQIDLLNLKFNKNKSYWIQKSNLKKNMKKQF